MSLSITGNLLTQSSFASQTANSGNRTQSLQTATGSLTTSPSSVVSLSGQTPETVLSYEMPAEVTTGARGEQLAWRNTPTDDISTLMGKSYNRHSASGRFNGLGSALLERFRSNQNDYHQTLARFSSTSQNAQDIAKASATAFGQVKGTPSDAITLNVVTQSGKTVTLTLANSSEGMSVDIHSSGTLSQEENDALANLSGAFEQTLNALAEQPPHIDIGALGNFDTTALKSVDLEVQVNQGGTGEPLNLNFHADQTTRALQAKTAAGNIDISVDLSKSSTVGSSSQHDKAINSYLKQVDAAATRGKANAELIRLFKESFTGLHANPSGTTSASSANSLNTDDMAMLTGLGDFTASITATVTRPNPMRQEQTNQFNFSVSQKTSITHSKTGEQTVSQQQTAKLIASFHTELDSDKPPVLGLTPQTQNYLYYQIDDSASSTSTITHDANNQPLSASVEKSVKQSLTVQRYEMGTLTEEKTTPLDQTLSRNLLDLIKTLHQNKGRTTEERAERASTFNAVNAQIDLETSAVRLQAS